MNSSTILCIRTENLDFEHLLMLLCECTRTLVKLKDHTKKLDSKRGWQVLLFVLYVSLFLLYSQCNPTDHIVNRGFVNTTDVVTSKRKKRKDVYLQCILEDTEELDMQHVVEIKKRDAGTNQDAADDAATSQEGADNLSMTISVRVKDPHSSSGTVL